MFLLSRLPASGCVAGGQLPHRRPAPATPAAPGAGRAGPAAGGAARRAGPARPGDALAAGPPAGRREPLSEPAAARGPPGAARATPSSPRSWCRPGPTGMPHELAELLRRPGRRAGPDHPAGAADRLGRRPAGPARPAGRGVRAGRPTPWSRRCGTRSADHVLVAVPGAATDGDAYAFRHALLREAVYHELLPGERSRIHAGYAALLADAGDRRRPSRAAPPSWRTTRWPAHDLPLALAASVRAAGEADEREAPAELLLHAERALELWRAVPDAEAVAGIDEATVDPVGGLGGQRHRRPGPRHRARPARAGAGRAARRPGAVGPAVAAVRAAPARPGRPRTGGARGRRAVRGAGRRPAAVRAAGLGARGRRPGCSAGSTAFAEATTEAETGPRGGRGGARRRPRTRRGRAPTPWSRWPCAHEYQGRAGAGAATARRGDRAGPAAGHLGVELRAYLAVGISLLDAGRLRAAGDQLAAGARRAEADRHHLERLRAGPAGGAGRRPLRCTATGTRAAAAAELAGESVSATVAAAAGRGGAARRRPAAAGSRRSTDGWPSCARPTPPTTR